MRILEQKKELQTHPLLFPPSLLHLHPTLPTPPTSHPPYSTYIPPSLLHLHPTLPTPPTSHPPYSTYIPPSLLHLHPTLPTPPTSHPPYSTYIPPSLLHLHPTLLLLPGLIPSPELQEWRSACAAIDKAKRDYSGEGGERKGGVKRVGLG